MNEKDDDEDKQSQINKKIIKMEQKCHEQIKEQEKLHFNEMDAKNNGEKAIISQRSNPNPDELFTKILEKSIYAKARDKMK